MAAKAKKAEPETSQTEPPIVVQAIKGIDANIRCKGFEFRPGETFTHKGEVKLCESGFHACPVDAHPLSVFEYYAPAGTRYWEAELSGAIDGNPATDDKVCAASITLKVEIALPDLIQRAIKWVFDRSKPQGAASATGTRGAASATGDQGAASATGDQGAASATGYRGAASATGDQGVAFAAGFGGYAKAAASGAIFLVERDAGYNIVAVFASKVGQNGIKPDTYYRLDGGKPVEAAALAEVQP